MIDTIIFDFGDVFINLDKEGSINALKKLKKDKSMKKTSYLAFKNMFQMLLPIKFLRLGMLYY